MASRLAGFIANLISRFTPGILISNYEVYEALRRAIEEDRRARRIKPQALEIAKRYHRELPRADPSPMVIHRRISKLNYEKRYVQASAIVAYRRKGVKVSPGMTVGYVVRDADQWEVDTEWDASDFDIQYYGKLLGKAWDEAAFVFKSVEGRCS